MPFMESFENEGIHEVCLWNFFPRSRFYGERGLGMLTWNAPVNGRVQVEKSRERPLAGQRILFAEDEGLIALELERMLEDFGCCEFDPAPPKVRGRPLSMSGIAPS
jgi:hypothetical protein